MDRFGWGGRGLLFALEIGWVYIVLVESTGVLS